MSEDNEMRDCISCGQLVFNDIVSDFESAKCELCTEEDNRMYDMHQAKLNRDFERELLP